MAINLAEKFDVEEWLELLEQYQDLADLPKREKIKKPIEKDGDVIDD